MASVKRFIAGAICPKCKVEDKIYTLAVGGAMSRHCNNCDFSESMDREVTKVPTSDPGEWQPIKLQ